MPVNPHLVDQVLLWEMFVVTFWMPWDALSHTAGYFFGRDRLLFDGGRDGAHDIVDAIDHPESI